MDIATVLYTVLTLRGYWKSRYYGRDWL